MVGTQIYIDGNKQLRRDGDRLLVLMASKTDATGAPIWLEAPPEEVEGILRGAVLHLDNQRRDQDQAAYDRAENESLRRARERR